MKIYVTKEQEASVLPDGESVHTFMCIGPCLVGADWGMEEILDKLGKSDVLELAGPGARGLGHGLCAYNKTAKTQGDILFIETNEERLAALEKELEGQK